MDHIKDLVILITAGASGIGSEIAQILSQADAKVIICDNDQEAIEAGRQLARQEGLLSGISSGAAVSAALKIGKRPEMENKRLVVILPSFGERYLSTSMFNNYSSITPKQDGYI